MLCRGFKLDIDPETQDSCYQSQQQLFHLWLHLFESSIWSNVTLLVLHILNDQLSFSFHTLQVKLDPCTVYIKALYTCNTYYGDYLIMLILQLYKNFIKKLAKKLLILDD